MKATLLTFLATLLMSASLVAEEQKSEAQDAVAAEPKSNTTSHSIRIDGQSVEYEATVGWLILRNENLCGVVVL